MVILTIILWPMVGYPAIMLMPFSSLTSFHQSCPFLHGAVFFFSSWVVIGRSSVGLVSFVDLPLTVTFWLKESFRLPVMGASSETHKPFYPASPNNHCFSGYFHPQPLGKVSIPEPGWVFNCGFYF